MKRVEILWHDAYTRDSWEPVDEAVNVCKPLMLCKTIGWLLDEDDKHIAICHTFNASMVMGSLHIPKGMIKKIRYFNK